MTRSRQDRQLGAADSSHWPVIRQATIDGKSPKQHPSARKLPIHHTQSVPSPSRCHHNPHQPPQHDHRALYLSASKSSPIGATETTPANQHDSVSQKLSNFIECSVSGLTMPPLPAAMCRIQEESESPPVTPLSLCSSTLTNAELSKVDPNKDNSRLVDDDSELDRDTDSGYAWIILAVVFTINASTFGTARAYGLIFDKLARADDRTRTQAAMPFTIMGAVENMAGPMSGYLLARTGSWRLTVFLGSCLITLAHFLAAAFDSELGQLLSMGFMCGLGLSLVTISFFQVNNAYFVRYRSTAFGLGLTGAAFGTLYISPLCQYFLDNYGTNLCYLMLGLILLPNVLLSLLLKPKKSIFKYAQNSDTHAAAAAEGPSAGQYLPHQTNCDASHSDEGDAESRRISISTVSGDLMERERVVDGVWTCIKRVLANPMFHLIWPTQLLFCWFNFVFGMIIVDFGKDRGLSEYNISHLVPIWAFGQLTGRMLLGSLVDLKFISYKLFTVICFTSIGTTTWALNNVVVDDEHQGVFILSLIFVLSMFIALLYIVFNSLVVNYVETSLQPLSIGISSFAGSFFLLPRAYVIGYYRDTTGNYDSMLTLFTRTSWLAALTWLLLPWLFETLARCCCPTTSSRLEVKTISTSRTHPVWLKSNKSDSHSEERTPPSMCNSATLCQPKHTDLHSNHHCGHTNPNYHKPQYHLPQSSGQD